MRDKDLRITPSVIDRLIDYEPQYHVDAPKTQAQSLNELKASVKRDVEWLLNSRHPYKTIPEGLSEVADSLAQFGIPDFTGMSSKDENERKNLVKSIEESLNRFEPRLMNVVVTFEETDVVNRGVKFQIEGLLRVDPTPEPIVFDTVLTAGTSRFTINERR